MPLPIDTRIVAVQLRSELKAKRRSAVVPIGLALLQQDPDRWLGALLGTDRIARAHAALATVKVLSPPPEWFRETALGLCVAAALRYEEWGVPASRAARMLGVTSEELSVLLDGRALRPGPDGEGVHAGDLFHLIVVGKPRLRAV